MTGVQTCALPIFARRLSQQADSWFESLAADLPERWSLIATGGYARGVLAPGSDIDVVLLHPTRVPESRVREVAERLWYPMWDAGLKLSPGAHTQSSLLQLAGDELDSATSILSLRCLGGDPAAVQALQERLDQAKAELIKKVGSCARWRSSWEGGAAEHLRMPC